MRGISRTSPSEVSSLCLFDGVEIRAVWRKVFEPGADAFDHCPDPWPLVAGQVVHDHDVAGVKLGQQHLLDIGFKTDAVDRPVDDEGRDEAP